MPGQSLRVHGLSLSLGMKKRRVAEEAAIATKFVSRSQNLRETWFTGAAHWVNHKMILTVPEKSDRFGYGWWNGQGVVSKYF